MELAGKHAIITGAASGIGRALAARFRAEGARAVVLADLPGARLDQAAAEIGGQAIACDATDEAQIRALVATAEAAHGPVDVFVSNAGIYRPGGAETSDADWRLNLDLHLMAHVYATRALLPGLEQRSGYFIITASAAGLLTHINSASYACSKHAAVAYGEYLAINHGPREPGGAGLRVSVLAPQAVRTAMTMGSPGAVSSVDGMLEPDQLADAVIATMAAEHFLILTHPQVLEYMRRKTSDYDRWIAGMRRLKSRFTAGA